MTRVLTEPEDTSMESLLWAGAQDNGSIEASCVCETYDWWKRCDGDGMILCIGLAWYMVLEFQYHDTVFSASKRVMRDQRIDSCTD